MRLFDEMRAIHNLWVDSYSSDNWFAAVVSFDENEKRHFFKDFLMSVKKITSFSFHPRQIKEIRFSDQLKAVFEMVECWT